MALPVLKHSFYCRHTAFKLDYTGSKIFWRRRCCVCDSFFCFGSGSSFRPESNREHLIKNKGRVGPRAFFGVYQKKTLLLGRDPGTIGLVENEINK